MAVGVPEIDVFAAADAVLARGERPTVERVRLELGRGSPARVGGLLDQWWEQLAGRLRNETRLPALPPEVAQAFIAVWQVAAKGAEGLAEQSLTEQRQVLADERANAIAVEDAARQEVADYRQQAAAASAEQRIAERGLLDLERLLTHGQRQIEDLTIQREGLKVERDAGRERVQELERQLLTNRHDAEKTRSVHEAYVRGVEERAHREIDRAREDAKASQSLVKQFRTQIDQLQKRREVAAEKLSEVQQQSAGWHTLAQQRERQRQGAQEELELAQIQLSQALKDLAAQEARAETLEHVIAHLRLPANPKPKKTVLDQTQHDA